MHRLLGERGARGEVGEDIFRPRPPPRGPQTRTALKKRGVTGVAPGVDGNLSKAIKGSPQPSDSYLIVPLTTDF